MFCKNCGKQNAIGAKFCGGCGADLTIQQVQPQTAYQPPVPPQPGQYQPPVPPQPGQYQPPLPPQPGQYQTQMQNPAAQRPVQSVPPQYSTPPSQPPQYSNPMPQPMPQHMPRPPQYSPAAQNPAAPSYTASNPAQFSNQPFQPQSFSRQQPRGNFNTANDAQWSDNVPPLSVKEFVVSYLLLLVPILGLYLIFKWSFGKNVNLNKRNFARAVLILSVIGIIFYAIFGAVMIGGIMSSMGM